jgi:hypothetical protein
MSYDGSRALAKLEGAIDTYDRWKTKLAFGGGVIITVLGMHYVPQIMKTAIRGVASEFRDELARGGTIQVGQIGYGGIPYGQAPQPQLEQLLSQYMNQGFQRFEQSMNQKIDSLRTDLDSKITDLGQRVTSVETVAKSRKNGSEKAS